MRRQRVLIAIVVLITMLLPHFLNAEEVVVVLLMKSGCGPCESLKGVLNNPELTQTITTNKQLFKVYYGEDWPKYTKKYGVTSYPTILKFTRDKRGDWVVKDRMVGFQKLDFLLDFLGKRSIIKRVKEIPRKVILGGS
jgi:thiol-disulfide isomerase/thioredoxin